MGNTGIYKLSDSRNWLPFAIALYSLFMLMSGACIYLTFFQFWQITMFFVMIICMALNVNRLQFNRKIKLFLALFIVWNIFMLITYSSYYFKLSGVSITFTAILAFYLQIDEDRRKTLHYFLILTTIVLFLGLIEYILYLFGIKLILGVGIERGEGSAGTYIVTLFNVISENERMLRFQGLFREPGHVGTVAGLLMFSLPKINKKLWFLWLLFGLFSLSLAFYILALLSIIIIIIRKPGKKVYRGLIAIAAIAVIAYFFINPVRDAVDKDIINRAVEYRTEGYDNRIKADLSNELYNPPSSFEFFCGYGVDSFMRKGYSWGNTGIKADLYKYGIVGVLFISLCVLILLKTSKLSLITIFLFFICYYNGNIPFALHFHIPMFAFLASSNIQNIPPPTMDDDLTGEKLC